MNLKTEIPSSSWKWFIWDTIKAETGQSNNICIGQICLQEAKTLEAVWFMNIKQHYQVFHLKKHNSCVSGCPHAHTQRNTLPRHGISDLKQSQPRLLQGVRQVRVTTIFVSSWSQHKPALSLGGSVGALTQQDADFKVLGSFNAQKAHQTPAKMRRGKKSHPNPRQSHAKVPERSKHAVFMDGNQSRVCLYIVFVTLWRILWVWQVFLAAFGFCWPENV